MWYKKAQGIVHTHLISGIAKHHRRNELETTYPHAVYARANGVEPHAYGTYQGRCLDIHPSAFEIGDFDIKDESAERSLGLCGWHSETHKNA